MSEITNVAEYVDIYDHTEILNRLLDEVWDDSRYNLFGKTPFVSYSLEHNYSGKPTGYEQTFDEVLSNHRLVHKDYQFRSTGFNTADSTEKDCFAHTDVDLDTAHEGHYNLVIPVRGKSRIDFFKTDPDEIYLPETNAHGYAYYHEFKVQKEMGQNTPEFESYLAERKIGEIELSGPILLNTLVMHRVVVTEAPRAAWVTRWNNIPSDVDFQTFKNRVETVLA